MYPPSLRQPIQQLQQRKYWKTYVACSIILTILGAANMIASVHSMYSTNTSQELEFKRKKISQQIRELEQQRAESTNLQTVQQLAEQSGYTPVKHIQYVEMLNTQIVAQR